MASLAVLTMVVSPSRVAASAQQAVYSIPLPLIADGTVLGEVAVRIGKDVSISPAELLKLSGNILTDDARTGLTSLGATPVPLTAYAIVPGLSVRHDPLAMEIHLSIAASARKRLTIGRNNSSNRELADPALFSGYLNSSVSLDHDWANISSTALSLELEGALNYRGLLLEGEAAFTGPLDTFLCPLEAICKREDGGFKRRGTRLVHDHEPWQMRTILGDTSHRTSGNGRALDLLGISLAHDPATFGHTRQLGGFNRPLELTRPATVTLVLNGAPIRSLSLQPGRYDLTDLPLAYGANTLTADITYDSGERFTLDFDSLHNPQLLTAGTSQWSLSGGLPAVWQNGERNYLSGFIGGASYRHGLSEHLTASLQGVTDSFTSNARADADILTQFGTFRFAAAASYAKAFGYSLESSWESLPANGMFRLAATYYSDTFRIPGDRQLAHTDVLYPAFDSWLTLTGQASLDLPWGLTASLSGHYAFARDIPITPGAVSVGKDRWSATASISTQLYANTSLSITTTYGRSSGLSFLPGREASTQWTFGIGLSSSFGHTHINARHATGDGRSDLNASTHVQSGSTRWITTVNAERSAMRGEALMASAAAYGQHGNLQLTQHARQPAYGKEQHRSRLRYQGGIAFADGHISAGAPITGAFALVHPHGSLKEATVTVGHPERPKATGTWLPALIPDLPAYVVTTHAIDAPDAPVGYTIGNGAFSVKPPYKTGYAIPVGSAFAITVTGSLADAHGKPIVQQHATAISAAHPGKRLNLFTNRAGRFGGDAFAPGTWALSVNGTEGPLSFNLVIPNDTEGIHDTGTLHPN